jgi:leucyl aminopeptidase (aminopeptidase T)
VIYLGTLEEGARTAVEVCMSVKNREHVLVLTDRETFEVGNAVREASEKVSKGNVKLFVLEEYVERPAKELPKLILETIPWANVTFYAAASKLGELSIRRPFIRTALRYARHGHMPGITKELMETGMCADYMRISDLTKKVERSVKGCTKARVVTKAGTELEVEFNPAWRWKLCDGLYPNKGMWGNLPEGEIYTAAYKANGRMVIDELGDWFSAKYGVITKTPVSLHVKDSRVDLASVACSNEQLRKEFTNYLTTDENSNRLGEFAIGTNIFLERLTGNLLQDEKFPSVHCAFGDPYPDETGADWKSTTHVDCIMLKSSVWINGKQIMDEGKHLAN